MSLGLPVEAPDSPSNPLVIYAFVQDHVQDIDLAGLARVEDRLHDRLRILREREQDPELIRQALVLCANRRREITAEGGAAQPALHGNNPSRI